ncbi:MAG: sugar phosphate isomerase/epimerase family protein [Gemmata sp.]
MFLGYNTNGFAHHRLEDAIEVLAALGYRGVGLTLDVHHLDPFAPDLLGRAAAVRQRLERHNMRCVIETGARFLLDARRKHHPTLLSPTPEERDARLEFLERCVDVASELRADCVSFWSGAATDAAPHDELMRRLTDGCKRVVERAERAGVVLAFEPEPGMFIDTMSKFEELHRWVGRADVFRLTVDVGHLVCNRELPVSTFLEHHGGELFNVHIEDMRAGTHDHLIFGAGEVDFADVFAGLRAANYTNGVYVELSRHSYDAVSTARGATAFLAPFLGGG